MKNYSKLLIISLLGFLLCSCNVKDYNLASKKAGFDFSLLVENPKIKAKKGRIEVKFNFNNKNITITKTDKCETKEDIDGVCIINNKVNKKYYLLDCIPFNLVYNDKNIIIANFSASGGYYSIFSKEGFNKQELLQFYRLIEEIEAPKDE